MATPSKTGKNLVEYNCKNAVYSLDKSTISPLTYLNAVTTEKNLNATDKYGDGDLQLTLINDKGSTGTLELTARDSEFEKDLGFSLVISQGLADIQVLTSTKIDIGFETSYMGVDGIPKTKKVWFLGCQVQPAGESFSQNTDGINESTASYPITIRGVDLLDSDGVSTYTDSNGNTIKVWKVSNVPTDVNYDSFLDSVPTPKYKEDCVVTFDLTPSDATVVVESGEEVVEVNDNGTYTLTEGSYTYSVTKTGYTPLEDEALTIESSDVTTGTKTVTAEISIIA